MVKKDIWSKTRSFIESNNIAIDIVIELTRKCNLKCIHCYNVKDDSRLSFPEIDDILDQLKEAGCLFIGFTGGEVFLRDDIIQILELTRTKGFDMTIITNGTFIDKKMVQKLKEISPSDIGVSLYGTRAITHEKITQVKGSFKKTLKAVKMLKSAGLPVHIKCTLMRQNINAYQKIESFAKELDVTCIIDPTISPRDDGSCDVLEHRITDKQMQDFYFNQFSQIKDDKDEPQALACLAGHTFGSISTKGDVYPCIQLPLSAGNIFKENFKKIWTDSPILNKIREENLKGLSICKKCDKYLYCSRCPGLSYLEDGDVFACSTSACFAAKTYESFKKNNKA